MMMTQPESELRTRERSERGFSGSSLRFETLCSSCHEVGVWSARSGFVKKLQVMQRAELTGLARPAAPSFEAGVARTGNGTIPKLPPGPERKQIGTP
jgi:hypothetical protein